MFAKNSIIIIKKPSYKISKEDWSEPLKAIKSENQQQFLLKSNCNHTAMLICCCDFLQQLHNIPDHKIYQILFIVSLFEVTTYKRNKCIKFGSQDFQISALTALKYIFVYLFVTS